MSSLIECGDGVTTDEAACAGNRNQHWLLSSANQFVAADKSRVPSYCCDNACRSSRLPLYYIVRYLEHFTGSARCQEQIMAATIRRGKNKPQTLPKCPTGIAGLDEITGGGLPR